MRIYGEVRLSPTAQADPLTPEIGSVLIPRGASVGALIHEPLLNRVGTYWDLDANRIKPREQWLFDDRGNSMPPRVRALDCAAWLARNPDVPGVARPVHLFVDLEGHADDNDGRESLAASYYLRAILPKSIKVSTYSRWSANGNPERLRPFFENDDAAVYTLYAWNRVMTARDPVDEWARIVAEYEDEIESVEPDKPRVAFVTPRYQVYWTADPQWSNLVPLNNTPLPVDFWRQMRSRLQKPPKRNGRAFRPWDLYAWGPYRSDVAPHVDILLPDKD